MLSSIAIPLEYQEEDRIYTTVLKDYDQVDSVRNDSTQKLFISPSNQKPNKISHGKFFDQVIIEQNDHESSKESVDRNKFMQQQDGFSNEIWRQGSLRILHYIMKFVTILLQGSQKFKFTYITARQFQIINDKSACFKFYITNNYVRGQYKPTKLGQVFNRVLKLKFIILLKNCTTFVLTKIIKVIKPDSIIRFLWDSILFLTLLVNIFYVPLKVGFKLQNMIDNDYILRMIMDIFPTIILMLDIFINFNKGFYQHGELNLSKLLIAKNYINQSFCSDLLIVLTFSIVKAQFYFIDYFDLVILLKFKKVVQLFEDIEEFLNLRERFSLQLDVSKLMFLFIFISHLFACAWHLIAVIEPHYGYSPTWIDVAKLDQESWFRRYIFAIYWSSITTLTIGYGDIVPQTDVEKVFVTVVVVISSVVFGYTISSVGSIFSKISKDKSRKRDQISQLIGFTKNRGIDKALQDKIKKSYEYYFEIQQSKDKDCVDMIQSLSTNLKYTVNIELYKKLIHGSSFFRETFSQQFVDDLCQIVKEKRFIPREQIFQSGQRIDKVYFINNSGQIKIYVDRPQTTSQKIAHTIGVLEKGQILGERQFITGEKSQYSAQSTSFTNVAYIQYTDLYNLFDKHPADKERFLQIKNKVQMKESVKYVGCEICHQNHEFLKCQFVFYNPYIRKIIKQQDFWKQQRAPFQRNHRVRLSLKSKQIIQEGVLLHGIDNGLFQESDINEAFIQKYDFAFLQSELYECNLPRNDLLMSKDIILESKSLKRNQLIKSSNFIHNRKNEFNHSQEAQKEYNQEFDGYIKQASPRLIESQLDSDSNNKKSIQCTLMIPDENQIDHKNNKQQRNNRKYNTIKLIHNIPSFTSINLENDVNQLDSKINYDTSIKVLSSDDKFDLYNHDPLSFQDQTYQAYILLLKEDQLPQLDKRYDFQNYYPLGNSSNILIEIQRIQRRNIIATLMASPQQRHRISIYSHRNIQNSKSKKNVDPQIIIKKQNFNNCLNP